MKNISIFTMSLLALVFGASVFACECTGDPPGDPDCYECVGGEWQLKPGKECGQDSDCTDFDCYFCNSDCECECDTTVEYVNASTTEECIGETVTFNVVTIPKSCWSEVDVSWSGGGNPATGTGHTFYTSWDSPGNKTVIASICEGASSDSANVTIVSVSSVSSDKDSACVNCDITFTVTTNPAGHEDLIEWSAPGAVPSSQSGGANFTTSFNSTGTKTVTASCCSSSDSKDVIIAAPTNFHQTYSESRSNGVLYFEYEWDSTSGNLAHLNGCLVGEKVDYPDGNPYQWPNPPWYTLTNNPFVVEGDARAGILTDVNRTGLFITPYQAASFSSTQIYRYKDCDNNYTTLMGPYSIDREVYTNPYCSSGWTYRITKTGQMAYTCLP